MNKRLGLIALVVTSILFSTYGVFSRILNNQLSVYQQLSYRYTIGIVIVLFIIYFMRKQKISLKKFLTKGAILFALLIPLSFYFFIAAFVKSKLSISISGFYMGVLLSSIVIGFILLKEKLTLNSKYGLVLLFVGFFFLNNLKLVEITSIGLVYGLLSGVAYGIASYFKKSLSSYSKEELLLLISFATAVLMQSFSLINHEAIVTSLAPITILALVGFICVALCAEYLTIVGFRNYDLQLGSIILSLEIFFTVILGYFLYGEITTVFETIGVLLILGAVILSNISLERKESRINPT